MSQKGKEYGGKSFLIPQRLFEIIKSFISTETFNSIKLNWNIFWRKFYKFTKTSFGIVILSNTRNMQFLFPLKDKNDYKPRVICKGGCSFDLHDISETKRNSEVILNKHNNPTYRSESLKELWTNLTTVSHGLPF